MARLPTERPPAKPTFASGRARQAKIIRVMRNLTAQHGEESVRMQDVAKEADVALNTLYRYFPSKSHLLVAILEEELETLAETAPQFTEKPAKDDEEATQRILSFLAPAAESMFSRPLLARAMMSAAAESKTSAGEPITISYKNLEDALLAALAIANPTAQDRRMMFAISLTWSSAISAVLNGRIDREEYQEVLALTVRQLLKVRSV